jgi:hypothetical protein
MVTAGGWQRWDEHAVAAIVGCAFTFVLVFRALYMYRRLRLWARLADAGELYAEYQRLLEEEALRHGGALPPGAAAGQSHHHHDVDPCRSVAVAGTVPSTISPETTMQMPLVASDSPVPSSQRFWLNREQQRAVYAHDSDEEEFTVATNSIAGVTRATRVTRRSGSQPLFRSNEPSAHTLGNPTAPAPRRPSTTAQQHLKPAIVPCGLELMHTPFLLAQLVNPLNNLVLLVAIVRCFDSLHFTIVSIVTLVGAPYDTSCPRAVTQPDVPDFSNQTVTYVLGSALPMTVCDASATLNQFNDGLSLSLMAGFLLFISAPLVTIAFEHNPRLLYKIIVAAAFAVAVILDVALWVVLTPLPSGSRFAPNLVWCWIPNDGSFTSEDKQTAIWVLRFLCSYMFIPVFIALGFACYFRFRSLFNSVAWFRKCSGTLRSTSSEVCPASTRGWRLIFTSTQLRASCTRWKAESRR